MPAPRKHNCSEDAALCHGRTTRCRSGEAGGGGRWALPYLARDAHRVDLPWLHIDGLRLEKIGGTSAKRP